MTGVGQDTMIWVMAPTQVPWVDAMPGHWKVARLRYVTRCLDGRRVPLNAAERGKVQGQFPYWGANRVIDHVNDFLFDEPLVLLGEDGAPFFDYVRDVAFAVEGKIWVNNHAHVLRCGSDLHPRFLSRVLNSVDYRLFIKGSTRAKLNQQDMGGISVQLPPLSEQVLIVRYLDHAEMRIARAIAAKGRILGLLNEREELAIIEAVTKTDGQTIADPRLDWLGDVPAHWEVKRLGALLEERREMNYDRKVEQVLSLVRKRGVMRYEDKGRIGNKRSDDVARYKVVRKGDIVLNSMNVIIGSVGVSSVEGCLSPVYYVLRTIDKENDSAYFNALFQIERFHSSLIRFGKGILAHRMRIPMIELKAVMLPVPPVSEQREIAKRVESATLALKEARSAIENEISLLKEYRTRLISDVVTGKLDVRKEAASLKDVDPSELAAVLAGGATGTEAEGAADGDE
jgi:type I restriction enzyme S subunit